MLKGWIDRVFTLDFAYGLTSERWRGDVNGWQAGSATSGRRTRDARAYRWGPGGVT
jgi:putative NADPH-quinone reductase